MYNQQIASYITKEQKRKIQELAELEGLSVSAMVAELIDEAYDATFTANEVENDQIDD